jgi:hypothetical protein
MHDVLQDRNDPSNPGEHRRFGSLHAENGCECRTYHVEVVNLHTNVTYCKYIM